MTRSRLTARAGLTCVVAAVLGGDANNASAVDVFWDGTVGAWNDGNNWDMNIVPGSNDTARINNGGTAVIDATQTVTTGFATMGATAGTSGTLQMTGGMLTTNFDIRVGGESATGSGTGTFNQSGGTVFMNGGNVNLGFGSNGAVGTYNMSGGSLTVNSAAIFAVANRGTGTVNQTGGSVYVRGAATPGTSQVNLGRNASTSGGSGTYNLSAGDLTAAQLRFGNAVQGAGTPASTNDFNLSGTGVLTVGTISIVNTAAANSFDFTGGTLRATTINLPVTNDGGTLSPTGLNFSTAPATAAGVVTSPIGTTTINSTTGYFQNNGTLAIDIGPAGNDLLSVVGGPATLTGIIAVNEVDGAAPAVGSTFDVVTATDITNAATVAGLTPDGNFYEASVVPGGNGEILRLTVVVPEPASLAFVALAGLGLLGRRRPGQ